MAEKQNEEKTALSGYRILDLTEGGCLVAGKLMGDLGAEVIKVEMPWGAPSRNIGPFYKDIPHPEKSLFWMAYCSNKKSITLDLATADGQEVFKKLVRVSDLVIESFPPGYLEGLGLGYDILSEINPGIILTSITPFGQTGPKASYKFSNLTSWASHCSLYITGYPDRPPVEMSFNFQGALVGGMDAAVGSLFALWYREKTGKGQQVDVSLQDCGMGLLQGVTELWDNFKLDYMRCGTKWMLGGVERETVFPCKDGYVAFFLLGGTPGNGRATAALVRWMEEEGMVPDWMKGYDWVEDYDVSKQTQEEADRLDKVFASFLSTKTKSELFERSIKDGIFLAPIANMADLGQDQHLKSRGMWLETENSELEDTIIYYGPFARLSETPYSLRQRPPLIGEHNEEVYKGILGMSTEDLILLKQGRII